MLHPQLKLVGFAVSCENEYGTPSIVAMSMELDWSGAGMLDMLKNTGTTARNFMFAEEVSPE